MYNFFKTSILVGFIFLFMILTLNNNAYSQITKSIKRQLTELELGKRYLKLGNTWREVGEKDLSKEFLDKGYGIISKYNAKYYLGVYFEYLGYWYRDQGDHNKFLRSLKRAKAIYDVYGGLEDGTGSDLAINELIDILEKDNSGQSESLNNESLERIKELEEINSNMFKENNNLFSSIKKLQYEINELRLEISKLKLPSTGDDINNYEDINDDLTDNSNNYLGNNKRNIYEETNLYGTFITMVGGGSNMYVSNELRFRYGNIEVGGFMGYHKQYESMIGGLISYRKAFSNNWDIVTDIALGKSMNSDRTIADGNISFRYFIVDIFGLYGRVGYNLAYLFNFSSDKYFNAGAGICIKI